MKKFWKKRKKNDHISSRGYFSNIKILNILGTKPKGFKCSSISKRVIPWMGQNLPFHWHHKTPPPRPIIHQRSRLPQRQGPNFSLSGPPNFFFSVPVWHSTWSFLHKQALFHYYSMRRGYKIYLMDCSCCFWRSSSERVAKAPWIPLLGVEGADLFLWREWSSSIVWAFTVGALISWQIPSCLSLVAIFFNGDFGIAIPFPFIAASPLVAMSLQFPLFK